MQPLSRVDIVPPTGRGDIPVHKSPCSVRVAQQDLHAVMENRASPVTIILGDPIVIIITIIIIVVVVTLLNGNVPRIQLLHNNGFPLNRT